MLCCVIECLYDHQKTMPFNDVLYFILYVSFDLFAQYLKSKLQKRKKVTIYRTKLHLNYLHKFSSTMYLKTLNIFPDKK